MWVGAVVELGVERGVGVGEEMGVAVVVVVVGLGEGVRAVVVAALEGAVRVEGVAGEGVVRVEEDWVGAVVGLVGVRVEVGVEAVVKVGVAVVGDWGAVGALVVEMGEGVVLVGRTLSLLRAQLPH